MFLHKHITVVVQHQNPLIGELLTAHVGRDAGITVTGVAASGPELIQLCRQRRPDVAVFEADAPRWSNERLVELLLADEPRLRLIALHEALPDAYVVDACAAGVSAMVSYSRGLDALIAAIESSVRSSQKRIHAVTTVEPQGTRVGSHAQGVRVTARTATCPINACVRRVLHAHEIPVVSGAERGDAAVLIDPDPEQWSAIPTDIEVPIVVASQQLPRRYALEALAAGVAVLPAQHVDRLVVPAVRAARQGYLTVDVLDARNALCGTARPWLRHEVLLTKREREILGSIDRGQSAKDAARLLGISVRTVENLRSRLFRKLGVHSKAAALAAAKDFGLLSDGTAS